MSHLEDLTVAVSHSCCAHAFSPNSKAGDGHGGCPSLNSTSCITLQWSGQRRNLDKQAKLPRKLQSYPHVKQGKHVRSHQQHALDENVLTGRGS